MSTFILVFIGCLAIPVYFLLLMADGRKLRGKLLDRLTMMNRGRVLEGQARLITSEYDGWLAYPHDRDEPGDGNGHDQPRSASAPGDSAGSGPAL